jgi:hypothetical protein
MSQMGQSQSTPGQIGGATDAVQDSHRSIAASEGLPSLYPVHHP